MTGHLEPLILDLTEWVAKGPRPYAEMMEVWRTSCPRLMVWEEAVDRKLVAREPTPRGVEVHVTPAGRALLLRHGRGASAQAVCPPVAWPRAAGP